MAAFLLALLVPHAPVPGFREARPVRPEELHGRWTLSIETHCCGTVQHDLMMRRDGTCQSFLIGEGRCWRGVWRLEGSILCFEQQDTASGQTYAWQMSLRHSCGGFTSANGRVVMSRGTLIAAINKDRK